MLNTKTCNNCGRTVMWWQTPAGAWQLYDPVAVPFIPGVQGIAAHSRRGWVDAGTAWPEPPEMMPRHWCQGYEMSLALGEKGCQRVGIDLDLWLATNDPTVTPPPRRKASPARKRHAV